MQPISRQNGVLWRQNFLLIFFARVGWNLQQTHYSVFLQHNSFSFQISERKKRTNKISSQIQCFMFLQDCSSTFCSSSFGRKIFKKIEIAEECFFFKLKKKNLLRNKKNAEEKSLKNCRRKTFKK